MASGPKLANKISLEPQLDEQREREYETLVCLSTDFNVDTNLHLFVVTCLLKGEGICLAVGK